MKEILDNVSLHKLASVVKAVKQIEKLDLPLEHSISILILVNFTLDGIIPFLKYHLFASGINPNIELGGYNTMRQDVCGAQSLVNKDNPDIVVLALHIEQLDPSVKFPDWSYHKTLGELKDLYLFIAEHTSTLILINTFQLPFYRESGFQLAASGLDISGQLSKLNFKIREFANNHSSRFLLVDWELFSRYLGEKNSMDYRYGYLSKAPFANPFLNLYAREIAKVARALKGGSKKCLVLDCDNTLWGGIIGEDGLNKIQLDATDYPGKIYYDFQISLLHLQKRGVLLTLCSKNNEADVFEVLDNHPHCILNRKDFAGWRINWQDKTRNIRELSKELNIGLDSLVYVDDSPFECGIVQQFLPEVTVLQVPDKLYELPSLLLKDGLFDSITVSKEDARRGRMYRQESERKQFKSSTHNLPQYLASLEMEAVIHPVTEEEISRVAQLTQKTNQFNLTTHRYSEADINKYISTSAFSIYTLAARDRFGDLGVVGVIIGKKETGQGIIDSLLLSCRALGRDLEFLFIERYINDMSKLWGVSEWHSEFIRTPKNSQVENFWTSIGFNVTRETDSSKHYNACVGSINIKKTDFIHVIGE